MSWISEANIKTPTDQQNEMIRVLEVMIQDELDRQAQLRGYDNILSMCSYATSCNPKFKLDGQVGVSWRDQVWTEWYKTLSDVESGLLSLPTVESLVAKFSHIYQTQPTEL